MTDIYSPIRLPADDCLLYREVRSLSDCRLLQRDLDRPVQSSKTWDMEFNVKKSNIIFITNATSNNIRHQYTMYGESVCSADTCVYLGVTMNSKLRWSEHIDKISGAAYRLLGFLWRSLNRCSQQLKEKSYKAVVRPKVEYCSCIWGPYHQKYMDQLEMVQRRAARFVKSVPHRRTKPPTSVSAMISDLGWEPLQTRRLHGRLNMFFRITRGMVELLWSTIQYHGTI